MAIEAYHDEDSCSYMQVIKNTATLTESRLRATLKDLVTALGEIEARLGQRELYFFGLDPTGTWSPEEGEFYAGDDHVALFWQDVVTRPELHADARAYFEAALSLLKHAQSVSRSSDGIWECDTVQLAELGITVFACAQVEFVPLFTRFLRVWDMDHEVNQSDAIITIVQQHGVCPETEELLFTRSVEAQGQTGHGDFEEVADLFAAHHGGLAKAPLLRLIVSTLHTDDYEYRKADWDKYQAGEQSQPTNYADRDLVNAWCYPKLAAAVQPIIEELDAAMGPMPWLTHERKAG